MRLRYMIPAAAIALCAWSVPAYAQKDAKVEKGLKVYTDQKCSMCHSIGGHGNPKGPLDDVATKLKEDEIRQWITNAKTMTEKSKATRKPAMRQYNLPKEDVDALVAYLMSLKGTSKGATPKK